MTDITKIASREFANLCYKTPPQPRTLAELRTRHPTACLPLNFRARNRYPDVLPVEETRVKVLSGESDYINANFVKALEGESCEFICSQAPLPSTMNDFWAMVWQQSCPVIVTLNRLKEKGKIKGDPYWPKKIDQSKLFGNISVTLISKIILNDLSITIRKLNLVNHLVDQKPRTVYQLHFIGWPDFGVPSSSLPIRELVKLVKFFRRRGEMEDLKGPCAVHCSAGIGRTGTFIAIQMIMESSKFVKTINSSELVAMNEMIKKLKEAALPGYHVDTQHIDDKLNILISELNVMEVVLSLRQQRNRGMVQTEEQYSFIYKVLKDELLDHKTSISIQYVLSQEQEFLLNPENIKINRLAQSAPNTPITKRRKRPYEESESEEEEGNISPHKKCNYGQNINGTVIIEKIMEETMDDDFGILSSVKKSRLAFSGQLFRSNSMWK